MPTPSSGGPQPLRWRQHPARAARRTAQPAVRRRAACLIGPARALTKPVAPGVPDGSYDRCAVAAPALVLTDERGTTNLTVADRWGNVVEYTLTIEQIGGNAMVVPATGFLLNNELTDFSFTPTQWQRGRCEPAGTGQAAAQLDGTDDPAPPEA